MAKETDVQRVKPTNPLDELREQIARAQIGEKPITRSSQDAYSWLLDRVALYGLDTAEMAALLASAFTAMETLPTQSMSGRVRALTNTFASLQRSGMTVSRSSELLAEWLNWVDPSTMYRTRRDRRGRTYIVAEKVNV